MSHWTLLQITFNLMLFVGFVAMWLRLRRPPQDDPRMSRGLQLLQTKITVLEDLSDRTDNQVKQLSSLLDQKTRMIQNKILESEQQVLKIDHSMNKSLEVAEIFQDKIPHQEILERQRTVEYVRAARMAHSGVSVEDIAQSVHLPREQVELIAKFNREQLMFDENQLPGWVNKPQNSEDANFALQNMDFVANLGTSHPDLTYASQVEQDFKSAVENAKKADTAALLENKVVETLRNSIQTASGSMQPAVLSMKTTAQNLKEKLVATAEDLLRKDSPIIRTSAIGKQAPEIKRVVFPRIEK